MRARQRLAHKTPRKSFCVGAVSRPEAISTRTHCTLCDNESHLIFGPFDSCFAPSTPAALAP